MDSQQEHNESSKHKNLVLQRIAIFNSLSTTKKKDDFKEFKNRNKPKVDDEASNKMDESSRNDYPKSFLP